MVNLMCPPDWAPGCPDIQSNIILRSGNQGGWGPGYSHVSATTFLGGSNIFIGGMKQIALRSLGEPHPGG